MPDPFLSEKYFTSGLSAADLYGYAMEITDAEEARAYHEKLVAHVIKLWEFTREAERMTEGLDDQQAVEKLVDKADELTKKNLGYFAGYYGAETRERVERLFNCEHPVFGKIAEKGEPSAEEAFRMGMEMAKKGIQTDPREAKHE